MNGVVFHVRSDAAGWSRAAAGGASSSVSRVSNTDICSVTWSTEEARCWPPRFRLSASWYGGLIGPCSSQSQLQTAGREVQPLPVWAGGIGSPGRGCRSGHCRMLEE